MIRKIFVVLTAAIVGMGLIFAFDSPAQAAACPPAPSPVAHRGGEERYTENTDAAFRNASNTGVGFGETDVRFTADNVPVIMHDATVDRTTTDTGNVADLTYAQWQTLRTVSNLPVPALTDLMLGQSIDRAYMFVELKVTPTEPQWATFVAAITSRAGAGTPKPVIASFDPAVLDQVPLVEQGALAGYTRALIQSVGDANPADITPHASILVKHHDAITSTRLATWTGAGLKVYAWADPAADPPSEWARVGGYLNAAGKPIVSGYITATPGAYLEWRDSRIC